MKRILIKASVLISLSCILVLLSMDIGMFWDNVLLGSKIGKFLFENGIFSWSLPDIIDPGHPPVFASLLAMGWMVFGKSLAVSHWMMLPFIFALLWQVHSFISYFVNDRKYQVLAFILILSDPSFLSHLLLINPELIQLFLFFMALNAILHKRIYLKVISLGFLGIITYRGMMLCAGLFLIEIIYHVFLKKEKLKDFISLPLIMQYLIGATPAVLYLLWRYINKGWITHNPMEQWGNPWEYKSILDFLQNFGYNIVVLAHRFADFGRISVLVFVAISLWIGRRSGKREKLSLLIIINVFSAMVIAFVSLIIRNPIGHRYFIVSYICIILLAFVLLESYKVKRAVLIYIFLILSLLGGNFLVYPDRIAQGWDSSLAHLPYWKLRKEALEFLDEHDIPIEETASFFPNKGKIDDVDLNNDYRGFSDFDTRPEYVLYSNIYNLSDEDYNAIQSQYELLKQFRKGYVYVDVGRRKNGLLE